MWRRRYLPPGAPGVLEHSLTSATNLLLPRAYHFPSGRLSFPTCETRRLEPTFRDPSSSSGPHLSFCGSHGHTPLPAAASLPASWLTS